jgi:hypothetical protein
MFSPGAHRGFFLIPPMRLGIGLGRLHFCSYGGWVTGFLRFMGLLNAAVWLGAAVFCTLGVLPVLSSQKVMSLLGQTYFPYLSTAISRVIIGRLLDWQIFFALFAWLHLVLEWLYLGRTPRRVWVTLLTFLFCLSLLGGLWLNPKLAELHRIQHGSNVPAANRELAAKSFRVWEGVFQALNVLLIAGVGTYFWRLTTAEDAPRFVTPVKFRG